MEVLTAIHPEQGFSYFAFRQKFKKSPEPAPDSQSWLFYSSVTLDVSLPLSQAVSATVDLIVTLLQFPEYAQSIKTTNSANPRTLNCTGGDVGWRAVLNIFIDQACWWVTLGNLTRIL